MDLTNAGRAAFERITREIAQRGQASGISGIYYSFATVLDGDIVSRSVIYYHEHPLGIDGRNGAQISGSLTTQGGA